MLIAINIVFPVQNIIFDLSLDEAYHNNIPLTPYKIIPSRFAVKL